jgi:hypothetical protein
MQNFEVWFFDIAGERRRLRVAGCTLPGRVFKMPGDAVFEERAGWRGATKENTLRVCD